MKNYNDTIGNRTRDLPAWTYDGLLKIWLRMCSLKQNRSPHQEHTSPILWIRVHHTTAFVVTTQTLNNFNSHDFNNYPFLAYIYITYTILTKIT